MRVLALDAGRETGWAFFDGKERPKAGSKPFHPPAAPAQEFLGDTFALYAVWLQQMLDKFRPDVVGFATPFVKHTRTWTDKAGNAQFRKGDDAPRLRPLYGMIAEIERVAYVNQIRCVEVDEPAARRHTIGAVPRKSAAIKAAAIAACRQRGWPVTNDHAADALVVGDYIMAQLEPKEAWRRHPLFSRIVAVA